MIFFTLYETVRSCVGAAVFSVFMCALYEISVLLIQILTTIFCKNEYYIYKKGNNIKKAALKIRQIISQDKCPFSEYFNFLFTLAFGIFYIVMQFVLCDGVFRIYFLFITLTVFFFSKRICEKYLKGVTLNFLSYLCAVFVLCASMIFTPLHTIALKILKCVGSQHQPKSNTF